ncbi:MAG: hypothetical protein Q7K45_02440 [Nanoarchaeota archaeon]|nr:hypothetical protein [Nanoarchaeota archaeon]
MLNKKGIAMEQLVVIVIVIVSFMLIAGTLTRFLSKAEDKEAENLCRDSVAMRASLAVRVGGTEIKSVPQLCKTLDKDISGSPEELKQQIADKMARCWWMFSEGSYDQVLDNSVLREALGVAKSENDCFLCYTLSIKEDEIESESGAIPPTEMMDYLRDTQYPKIKGTTYLNYIQSYEHGGPGRVAVLDQVSPRGMYGVAFLAKNKNGGDWGWMDFLLSAGAGTAGLACYLAEPCGLIATIGVVAGGTAVGGLESYKAVQKVKAIFYDDHNDRTTSAIVFDNIKDIEDSGCLVEDIAGK